MVDGEGRRKGEGECGVQGEGGGKGEGVCEGLLRPPPPGD